MRPESVLTLLSAVVVGCSAEGPVIEPIADQVVAVGQELSIPIVVTSGGGAPVLYRFDSNVPELGDRASIARRPDGSAVFRFRPSARDIGSWVFDFHAVDDHAISTESIVIDVRSAIGNQTMPLFRSPLGAGTVLEHESDCVELDIEVSDQDSTEVVLTEQEPGIPGAELLQTTAMSAVWRWCPTDEQRTANHRYLLTLTADDGDNPAAIKRYQIILRESRKVGCSGIAPIIDHSARDLSTLGELTVSADVTDDIGLVAAPLVYYATAPPAQPVRLDQMIQIPMILEQGDRKRGRWTATIPNPVARADAGQRQTIHYVIVAEDNDDLLGDCDHVVQTSHQMTVTSPGGPGNQPMCRPCSADSQCGQGQDLCLRVGLEGDAFCMVACTSDDECPDGTVCSSAPLESIDGASARQCVPTEQTCTSSASECRSDRLEPNDRPLVAYPIGPGISQSLSLCGAGAFGSEDDWYRFDHPFEGHIELTLAGAADPDIDLALFDERGQLVGLTWAYGSNDRLSACLPAGPYWLRTFSLLSGHNDYSLTLTRSPGTCPAECTDDSGEDDDGPGSATYIDLDAAQSTFAGRQICTGDDDWYELYMFAGETVRAIMDFDMASPSQDLDLLIYDRDGQPITRCSEADPSGCSVNGQSGTPDEQLGFTPDQTGSYYLVVHGWAGAENGYDLCVTLSPFGCLPPSPDASF